MNNIKINSSWLTTWLVGITLCYSASVVIAGPLDRGEMQPRQNPAANSMIRIPGVLGQPERYAMETLQRSGLNVKTKYIRQSMKKYAGRNGAVVKQVPSAGGIAMLGSTIAITIYKVEGEPMIESGGSYGGSDDAAAPGSDDSGDGYGSSDSSAAGSVADNPGSDDSGVGYGSSDNTTGGSGDADPGSDGSDDSGSTKEVAPGDGSSGPSWGVPGSE